MKETPFILTAFAFALALAAKPPQNLKHHHNVNYCPFDVSSSLLLTVETAVIEVTYKNTREQSNLIVDPAACFVTHTLELHEGRMNNSIDMKEVQYEGKGKVNTLSVWSYSLNLAKSAAGPTPFTQALFSESRPSIVGNTTNTIPVDCCECVYVTLNTKTSFDLTQMAPGEIVKQRMKLNFFEQCELQLDSSANCENVDVDGKRPPRC